MMGKRKMKIADVAREAKLNRSTVTALYYEDATRIDIETIDKLCKLFECSVGDLLEHSKDEPSLSKRHRRREDATKGM